MINVRTKLIALLGHPIEHSLSPAMHNASFQKLGLNYVYLAFDLLPMQVPKAVDAMKLFGFVGYSVTMPLKEEILKHVDNVDSLAEKIGSVNTVVNESGQLAGYNTDVIGAMNALKAKTELKGKRVALLGAGGAGRAIAFGLKEEKAIVTILDKNQGRAKEVATAAGCSSLEPEKLNSLEIDILVNATPVGMFPNANEMPVEKSVLRKDLLVFDVVYNPIETMLIREAKRAGCETIQGIEMFLGQGAAQFQLWTGHNAPVELMREIVEKELQK